MTESRWAEARALRQDGMDMPTIGARLGISKQRVHQLLNAPEPTSEHQSEKDRLRRLGNALVAIERTRALHEDAAGEAFLPDGWQKLVKSIGPLLNVAEVAHELVYSTTHTNLTGDEYAERKAMYEKLRLFLDKLP